ncbi:putative glycerol kinase 5 [Trichoplax sp. H2]|nr:putative glycerol kinase 5 [Trichoplax sp. H2]|eukprot:RDD38569.1 putative glycerol kinase 5 [Trichoplax sp. H2]
MQAQYIAVVDVGTSKICCHIVDQQACVIGKSIIKIETIHPNRGWMEINPEVLWQQFIRSVQASVKDAKISIEDIAAIGMSTQRNSITIWNKDTGKTLYNFITWQDTRVSEDVHSWNASLRFRVARIGGKLGHFVTRHNFFKAASVLTFTTQQASVTIRLLWLLNNVAEARNLIRTGTLLYGCIETWLIWKMTGGKKHITDYSCASATGLFNPYMTGWSTFVTTLVGIPLSIFPKVVDSSGPLAVTDNEVFGKAIPITAIIADQQASLFGGLCFDKGDMKCTLGTGTFLTINCGSKPYASLAGLYPLIGWKLKDQSIVYVAEGNASSTGSVIDWLCSFAEIGSPQEIVDLVSTVDDTNGVYFVPAFNGLQAPYKDWKASPLLIGFGFETTKAHVARAILESFAYRVRQIYETFLVESNISINSIKLDGGVTKSSLVAQLISDVLKQELHHSTATNASILGAIYLTGLGIGIWKDLDDIKKLKANTILYCPSVDKCNKYDKSYDTWKKSVKRSLVWYS